MRSERIRHRIWRLGRLASSCLITAGLSLVGIYDDGGSELPLIEHR